MLFHLFLSEFFTQKMLFPQLHDFIKVKTFNYKNKKNGSSFPHKISERRVI